MGSFFQGLLPPGRWNGARDDSNELLEQLPGVNAPVPAPPLETDAQIDADFTTGMKEQPWAAHDINGLLDRQVAKRDLAKKLDVVPDDYKGVRKPNQVTQFEMDRLVMAYSNIRLGRGDLTLDAGKSADPAQFKRDAMDDIGDIMQTQAGREMITALSNNTREKDAQGNWIHRHTTIAPHLDKEGNIDQSNSTATFVGDLMVPAEGTNARFKDGRPGVGTDARINVNPNMDLDGSRSDTIMFHELAHALADTRGVRADGDVDAKDGGGGGNIEKDANAHILRLEHQAAGLGNFANDRLTENAYRRERRQLATTGKGLAGDLNMPLRENYSELPAPYAPFFGL